ncbi:MAG TPA: hypothetical protein VNC41_14210 [Acidimicrobiia bacterium]|nr:hypothetical protein [Acidimicrobiia bacterium]
MTTSNEPTRPDRTTRATEAEDAQVQSGSDQEPTPEEEAAAERAGGLDEDVSRTYEEAIERGAAQEGEGRLP